MTRTGRISRIFRSRHTVRNGATIGKRSYPAIQSRVKGRGPEYAGSRLLRRSGLFSEGPKVRLNDLPPHWNSVYVVQVGRVTSQHRSSRV
jgi:hypothetical protein